MALKFNWTKIARDVNGNPRYVIHFLELNTKAELEATGEEWIDISEKYRLALARAHQIGGKKFNNKQYGGGIVFQSYSLQETENAIMRVLAKDEIK